jgi:putative CocE/NonD family hydrolase
MMSGVFGSDGAYSPYTDDAQDGYDTVAWAHKQPWSHGKIGTFGSSARGITQLLLGPEQPPGLEAMYWVVTPSRSYEETLFQGGVYRHEIVTKWLAGVNLSYGLKHSYTNKNHIPYKY